MAAHPPPAGTGRTRAASPPGSRPNRPALVVVAAHAVVAAAAVLAMVLVLPGPLGRGSFGGQLVDAAGLVALIWAYAGLVLGLLIGIRPRMATGARSATRPGRTTVLSLHRQVNVVVLGLTLLHALSFALLTPGGSLLTALVPGIPGPQSLGFTLGVLALYLGLLLGPSYYFRDRIGRRTWLVAHQLAAFSYAVALWHSLGLGADLRLPGVPRTLTWVVQLPLLALIGLRLFRPRRPADQLSAALRRGRYTGRRHAVLRASMATGLIGSAVFVLIMALLASKTGQHVTE